jgi:AcrR family transcriptional regulator
MHKPRWQRRKDARPAEILTAALDVFAERGFAPAKLDEVAERAGVSKGTLYLYFKSKDDLFRSMVRTLLVPNIAQAERAMLESKGSASELLRQLILTFGNIIVTTKLGAIPKLIIAESGKFPDLARFYFDEVISRGLRFIGALIQRGVANGEFRPIKPEEFLPTLFGPFLVLGVWKHSFEPAGVLAVPTQQVLANHADFLLRALAPDGANARKEAKDERKS